MDTAFREDHNQTYIGNAAKNLGALRQIVLNLLKLDQSDTRSLPKKRRRAMLSPIIPEPRAALLGSLGLLALLRRRR